MDAAGARGTAAEATAAATAGGDVVLGAAMGTPPPRVERVETARNTGDDNTATRMLGGEMVGIVPEAATPRRDRATEEVESGILEAGESP